MTHFKVCCVLFIYSFDCISWRSQFMFWWDDGLLCCSPTWL